MTLSPRTGWRLHRSTSAPADWWARWDALNHSSGRAHPVLGARWAQQLLAHFPPGDLVWAELSDATGPAVMALVEPMGRLRWQCYQPSQAPLPLLVFRHGLGDGPRRLQGLLGRLGPAALACDLPCVDPHVSLLDGAGEPGFLDAALYGTTFAVTGDGFDAYWSARPKGLRQNIGRYFRRLERDGLAWRLETLREPGQMDEAVRLYGQLESAGWKGSAGSAVGPDNVQGRFYGEVLRDFAATGQARAYLMHAGERLVAGRLVVDGDGMAVMLKTAYDESLSQYAPGRLMTYLALQDLLEDPRIQRVEFYTKANRDALEWASEQRDLQSVTIFRNSLLRSAASWRRRLRNKTRDGASA